MERQLFDWVGWDEVDTAAYNFYGVVTKVEIGNIKAGSKFGTAFVDYQKGLLAFYDESGTKELYKFKIGLKVLMDVVE